MKKRHLKLVIARADQVTLDIPKEALEGYSRHFYSSLHRGIEFHFTLQEWWAWWQTDNRWLYRGRGVGKLVMARRGDVGPYEPNNVYCATVTENVKDVDADKRSKSIMASYARRRLDPSWKHHLAIRGEGHPRSRAVITPMGRFGSAAMAAKFYGVCARTAQQRAAKQILDWRFENAEYESTFQKRDVIDRTRAVITPKGRFRYASEAAVVFGITRQHAARLARQKLNGWRYETEEERAARKEAA